MPHVILGNKSFPVWIANWPLDFYIWLFFFLHFFNQENQDSSCQQIPVSKKSQHKTADGFFLHFTKENFPGEICLLSWKTRSHSCVCHWFRRQLRWMAVTPNLQLPVRSHTHSKTRLKKYTDKNPWARNVTLHINLGCVFQKQSPYLSILKITKTNQRLELGTILKYMSRLNILSPRYICLLFNYKGIVLTKKGDKPCIK